MEFIIIFSTFSLLIYFSHTQTLLAYRKKRTTLSIKEKIAQNHSRSKLEKLLRGPLEIFQIGTYELKTYFQTEGFQAIYLPYKAWCDNLEEQSKLYIKGLILFIVICLICSVFLIQTSWFKSLSLADRIDFASFSYHLISLIFLYLSIVRPFLKTKKVKQVSSLNYRNPNAFISKYLIFILGTLLFTFYLYSVFFGNTPFYLGTFILFGHLYLVIIFSQSLVEKGSPLDPSIELNGFLNQNIMTYFQKRLFYASFGIINLQMLIYIQTQKEIPLFDHLESTNLIITGILFIILLGNAYIIMFKQYKDKYIYLEKFYSYLRNSKNEKLDGVSSK